MEERAYGLLGVFGPLLVYFTIIISLALSPWFSWETNALSDLGNPNNSEVAPIFNIGLLLAGVFLLIYSLTSFKKHAKFSSYFLFSSTFFVQLLATFDESYGSLHYTAALPHFALLGITSIVYSLEKRSVFALSTFLVVMLSWIIFAVNFFSIGIAIPEAMSKLVLLWIMYSGIKIYFGKEYTSKP